MAAAVVGMVAALAAPGAPHLSAQDIEMDALVRGRALPHGYHERVARAPAFFEVRDGWIRRGAAALAGGPALEGELPLLVVPVLFADSPSPPLDHTAIRRVFFDGPFGPGTLAEYYGQQSGGRLTLTGEVVPWVRSGLTAAQVRGQSFALGDDSRMGDFLRDGLAAADAHVDFRLFDNDGPDGIPDSGDDDGRVDALVVEFLEAPVTCQGGGPTIWAHRARVSLWTGEPYVSDDVGAGGEPIVADDYITQAGIHCDGSLANIVVAAHETGHILGLPDLYDSTEGIQAAQRNWVVGCWSVMAAGQWGCGRALSREMWDRPPSFGPWEKLALGWLDDPVVVGDVFRQEFVLRPVQTSGDVLRVDLSTTEYLLVEYRPRTGFDRNLPGEGVLIHHVDETRPTGNGRCRGCPKIYEVALVDADGDRSLLIPEGEGGNRGEAGDLFGVGGRDRLDGTGTPSTRLHSGAPSGVTLEDIRVEDGVARLLVSTRPVALDRVLTQLLGGDGPGLSPGEALHLDAAGNGNGRVDVADLRRFLEARESAAAESSAGASAAGSGGSGGTGGSGGSGVSGGAGGSR